MNKVKVPTNREIALITGVGLGLISFGIWFIWIPFFGDLLLYLGGFMFLIGIAACLTKFYNRVK